MSERKRAAPIHREHILQEMLFRFTEHAIALSSGCYQFFSFDRSAQSGRFTHAREADRGVRRSTPDTLLSVEGLADIWWEAKDKGEEPNREQAQMLAKLRALGRFADWGDSVVGYGRFLADCGVPLEANWDYQATVLDGYVASRIARKEQQRDGVAKAPRKSKATPRFAFGKSVVRRARAKGILI